MTGPETNYLTAEELEQLQEEYDNATSEEQRKMEIRDLGYPLTQVNKTSDDEADDILVIVPFE